MHAIPGTRELVLDRGARRRRRVGVRHFEHGGHAAQHRRAAAGFKVFLVLVARLAEMDLGVHDARQHMQPFASNVSAALAPDSAPTAAIRPATTPTSAGAMPEGVATVPFLMRRSNAMVFSLLGGYTGRGSV